MRRFYLIKDEQIFQKEVIDYDGDNDLDLYVTTGSANLLFKNNGDDKMRALLATCLISCWLLLQGCSNPSSGQVTKLKNVYAVYYKNAEGKTEVVTTTEKGIRLAAAISTDWVKVSHIDEKSGRETMYQYIARDSVVEISGREITSNK